MPVQDHVRGLLVRLLTWVPGLLCGGRRLELSANLSLLRVRHVIQTAMDWSNSHLHRFLTDGGRRSPRFVTGFDVEEGEDGAWRMMPVSMR